MWLTVMGGPVHPSRTQPQQIATFGSFRDFNFVEITHYVHTLRRKRLSATGSCWWRGLRPLQTPNPNTHESCRGPSAHPRVYYVGYFVSKHYIYCSNQIFIYMPGEILAGLAGAVIPALGAQASAQMQRRWALEDLERQNQYNSPAEQLKRLKAAGLPAAAFFSSGASSQSDMPRSTQTDPTMGYAEGFQNYMQTRMQKVQMRAMTANTRSAEAKADIDEADRDWWLAQYQNAKYTVDPNTGERTGEVTMGPVTTPRKDMLSAEVKTKQASANIQQRIASWQERYGDQLNDAELNNLAANIARTELQIENEKLAKQFVNDFIEAYSSGNFPKMIRALVGKYLSSIQPKPQ